MAQPTPILIVDDYRSFGETLAEVLEDSGYSVELATGREDALAAARQLERCILIVDVKLAQENGFKLATELRRVVQVDKVLYVTAYVSQAAEQLKGADVPGQLVPKPVAIPQLLKALEAPARSEEAPAD